MMLVTFFALTTVVHTVFDWLERKSRGGSHAR